MAVATAMSRGTGFVRTLALAWALGVSSLADAYNLANTAPNMLFQLAAGGVLSSAVVPLLSQSDNNEARRENANVLFGAVVVVGLVASLTLAVAAPAVLGLLTAGADRRSRGAVSHVGTQWLILFAPQVLAYAVSVLCVGVLTSRRRLFVGALAPVLTNLLTIAGVVAFALTGGRRPAVDAVRSVQVAWLGSLTTAGVVVMAVAQLLAARRAEPGLRPRFAFRHPAIRHALGMAPWIVVYVVANQIGLAVVVALAATTAGGVTAYQWAFTVMQLPYALIAVSIVTAAFPRLAQVATEGAAATAVAVNRSLRRLLRVLLPAAAALAGVAPTIATAVVGPDGAALVAGGLIGFAVSLVPFSTFQLLTRASYTFRDARSPALVNLPVNVVNVAFDVAVVMLVDSPPVRVAGLAVGHAASYVVGCALLSRRLRTAHGVRIEWPLQGLRTHALAAIAIGIAALATRAVWRPRTQVAAAATLVAIAGACVALYAAAAVVRRRAPG